MFEKHSPQNTRSRAVCWRVGSIVAVVLALPLGLGCEDKGLGRTCNLGQTIEPDQGAYSVSATDCPSRTCIKPPIQPGIARTLDTAAYCSQTCNVDTDCQGQTRDRSDPNDKRCKSGFVCAIPFGAADNASGGGQLCCQKLCLCRDFFLTSVGAATPSSCKEGSGSTCATGSSGNGGASGASGTGGSSDSGGSSGSGGST
jgi:uncharacterized membrane protein YgcG